MRILHITPDIYEGGVATLIYEMSQYQKAKGHEVAIFCTSNNARERAKSEEFEKNNVIVIFSKYSSSYDPRLILEIRKLIRDYDLIHVHLFPNQFYTAIANVLTLGKDSHAFITTVHNTYNNRRKYPFFRYLDRWMYSRYDKVVSISGQTEINLKNWLGETYINRKKFLTISNGINLSKYGVSIKNKNANAVIMVSRLSFPKDPLTLVNAISKCKTKPEVYFVGTGDLHDEIRSTAKKLKIINQVHLLGNRNDVPELLSKASIGVLSTNWDGFGLVAVEYMAAALPVLASDVEGLRDVVGDTSSLFNVGDSDTLAKKIDILLSNDNLRVEKSKYFKERSKMFSIDKMNREYLNTYSEILNNTDSKISVL